MYIMSLFSASPVEAHEAFGQRRLFVWGRVGSDRVYEFTVTPLAPRPADNPVFLKVVSRIRASFDDAGIIVSLYPQWRHCKIRAELSAVAGDKYRK